MKKLAFLVRRNLRLFCNNRLNILLSFASILIVIGIYILFLRDFLLETVTRAGTNSAYVEEFTDRFMFSGLLVVINTTTCFGIIQLGVSDVETGIRRDYLVAPISRFSLTLGYWTTAVIISFFFTICTVLGGELFFLLQYGKALSSTALLQAISTVLFSSMINAAILLCLSRRLKSSATFSTLANLYGTLIGFLAGAYLPYSFYPNWLRRVLFYFPPTQTVSILRQIYIDHLRVPLAEQRSAEFVPKLLQTFGIELQLRGGSVSLQRQYGILTFLFLLLLLCLWAGGLENEPLRRKRQTAHRPS